MNRIGSILRAFVLGLAVSAVTLTQPLAAPESNRLAPGMAGPQGEGAILLRRLQPERPQMPERRLVPERRLMPERRLQPIRRLMPDDPVETVQADCYAVGQQVAAEQGGTLARASARNQGGRTVCVIVVLVPGRDGQRPRRAQFVVPAN